MPRGGLRRGRPPPEPLATAAAVLRGGGGAPPFPQCVSLQQRGQLGGPECSAAPFAVGGASASPGRSFRTSPPRVARARLRLYLQARCISGRVSGFISGAARLRARLRVRLRRALSLGRPRCGFSMRPVSHVACGPDSSRCWGCGLHPLDQGHVGRRGAGGSPLRSHSVPPRVWITTVLQKTL